MQRSKSPPIGPIHIHLETSKNAGDAKTIVKTSVNQKIATLVVHAACKGFLFLESGDNGEGFTFNDRVDEPNYYSPIKIDPISSCRLKFVGIQRDNVDFLFFGSLIRLIVLATPTFRTADHAFTNFDNCQDLAGVGGEEGCLAPNSDSLPRRVGAQKD